MNFVDLKGFVQEIIQDNKGQIYRNFPNVVYRQVRAISTLPLPENPAQEFSECWRGWRDFLGPAYFSSARPVEATPAPDDDLIAGVEERNGHDRRWNDSFIELQEYYEANGTLIVSNENERLQAWVSTQRHFRKRGLLKKDREACLNKIYFDWEPQQCEWDDYYKLIISFKELHGHVDVPHRYYGNYRLGQWVREQRIHHQRGHLRQDRVRKLEALGFKWVVPQKERHLKLEDRG